MAQAYVPIQTVTVGSGGAASIEFTNIPQNFTDLVVKICGRNTSTDATFKAIRLRPNGLTTNGSTRWIRGNGAAASSDTDASAIYLGEVPTNTATTSTFGNIEVYLPNYTSSNNKSFSIDSAHETNATTAYLHLIAGLWSSSTAISSITLVCSAGNFTQYSTATLYGIGGTRASGGTVTADGRYTYHTFTSTGTFTANEKIKGAEVLLIAGGGGGGAGVGGGGGAGGLRGFLGQTLTAGTSYSVIVGSGGSGGVTGTSRGSNGTSSNFISFSTTGGGGGGSESPGFVNGANGGSGGGPAVNDSSPSIGTGISGEGNNGGDMKHGGVFLGGSGGGAGGAGIAATTTVAGVGGVGSSSYSSWGYATSTGQLSGGIYYYAGGGGGGVYEASSSAFAGSGGLGGGGAGSFGAASATAGTANTGGGGGGTGCNTAGNNRPTGAAGGSGLVIIRYPN